MASTAEQNLAQLISDEWDFRMRENPTFATSCGDHRFNDRLPALTEADFARREEALRGFLERLSGIDAAGLSAEARLNRDLFERDVRLQLDQLTFGAHYIPLTKSEGLPVFFADVPNYTPFRTPADYENYVRRLRDFMRLVRETIELMRVGLRCGYAPPRSALAGVLDGFRLHASNSPQQSAFFQPFLSMPGSIAPAEGERLRGLGAAALAEAVIPGYRLLADFLENEYLPHTSAEQATLQMPQAQRYYEHCVRRYTSLEVTPAEVHEVGRAEVARIGAEMDEIIRQVGFQGSLREFSAALRSDARFFVDRPEQLLKEAAWIVKKVEGQLPVLFKTLPRTPFGLRETPAFVAPTSTSAYYFPPAGDGTTAGFYYVNTYDLKSRPLYEYEALSLHEAVPGHHLQIALQMEMGELPAFRKYGELTAFIEGWALYAERLGLEMGFYTTPYTNFGRLVYEMWRAARLVVDTGLHAFGWTRQQAIDYLAEHTALSLLNIANEVDRYISWPGQALAYKMGELKIRELRRRAEETLGARFDLREFHDVLLGSGGIPLAVIEHKIDAWLAGQPSPDR